MAAMYFLAQANASLARLLRTRGKEAFVQSLPKGARLLDVGCGNNSPLRIKAQRPDLKYTGIDVGDWHQPIDPSKHADRYILASKERFADEIAKLQGQFDAVISSHNLEHCVEPAAVLGAMLSALRSSGRLFLAFPCAESIRFPRRYGTLNFYDDKWHVRPPDFDATLAAIGAAGCSIDFFKKRYKPPVLFTAGLILEPLAAATKRTMPAGATWAYYGFESIIWASRP